MNNKEYIMIGTHTISKDIFRNILRPLNNYSFVPNGGFWASNYNDRISNISDWYNYLLDAEGIAYYKNMNDAVIFTLKENAKILLIDNDKQLKELVEKYPSYHHILSNTKNANEAIDFEELSKDYDGIYLDYNKLSINSSFTFYYNWSVNTLLLFNLDCIKEYRSAEIKITEYEYYRIPFINKESEAKIIQKRNNKYEEIYNYVQMIFQEQISKYDKIIFKDYDEYLQAIINCTNNCMEILYKNNINDIKTIQEQLQSQNLNIKNVIIIRNIVLNYLSNYLSNDKIRIKTLNKANNQKTKSYKLINLDEK